MKISEPYSIGADSEVVDVSVIVDDVEFTAQAFVDSLHVVKRAAEKIEACAAAVAGLTTPKDRDRQS